MTVSCTLGAMDKTMTSSSACLPASTSAMDLVSYPTAEISSTYLTPGSTAKENPPSTFVETPPLPAMVTEAPWTGSFLSLTTLPVIREVCANDKLKINNPKNTSRVLK